MCVSCHTDPFPQILPGHEWIGHSNSDGGKDVLNKSNINHPDNAGTGSSLQGLQENIPTSKALPEGVKDITGQRYGRLKAIAFDHLDEKGVPVWLFQCDCGNKKLISYNYVKYGKTKSCGCLRKEAVSSRHRSDIAGRKFGKLTAIEPTGNRSQNGSVIWRCKCDCGNEIEVSACKLKSGAVKSCGCLYKQSRHSCYEGRKDLQDHTSVSNLVRSKSVRSDSSSGYTGVSWNKSTSRWVAYITFQSKRVFLGSFLDKEDAIAARKEAEKKIHDPYIEEMEDLLSGEAKKKFQNYLVTNKANRKNPNSHPPRTVLAEGC